MNRFDRVTATLLLLQTRPVVTAGFLAERFGVSERTVYRDVRTLENAGVPIVSEAGVGYALERGYRLPPVAFTLDEAAALLLGGKLLASALDGPSREDFGRALDKVRAVLDGADRDRLASVDADVEVLALGSRFPVDGAGRADEHAGDRWLRECRDALVRRETLEIEYAAPDEGGGRSTARRIEPIGLYHYAWHWHLIAWCRLRGAYRDFRLDRVRALAPTGERFARRDRLTLKQYLDGRPAEAGLHEVELLFREGAARFVAEQRHLFGFVDEAPCAGGVRMRFLTAMPDYMARWLLQWVDEVEVLRGEAVREALRDAAVRLAAHWGRAPGPDRSTRPDEPS